MEFLLKCSSLSLIFAPPTQFHEQSKCTCVYCFKQVWHFGYHSKKTREWGSVEVENSQWSEYFEEKDRKIHEAAKTFTRTKFLILLRTLINKIFFLVRNMRFLRRLLWGLLSVWMSRHEYYCLQGCDIVNITVCRDVTSWILLSAGMWRREISCLQGYDIIEVPVRMYVTSWRLCDAMEVTVCWDVTP